jgi:uncharacterized protein DUF3175
MEDPHSLKRARHMTKEPKRHTTSGTRTSGRKAIARRRGAASWVRRVQQTSNAMDLPPGIFNRSAREIARGLRQSVRRSGRTKGTKFQSAMSMLNLYINRAGRGLSRAKRARLEAAKGELRKLFGRTPKAA